MSPNGHWVPTDHIYLQVADPDLNQSPVARRTAFFAPADGIVTDVFSSAVVPDVGLRIRVTTTVAYTLGHVIPDIPLARGTRITAGQRLGTTGSVFYIDLGLFDDGQRRVRRTGASYAPDLRPKSLPRRTTPI